MDDALEGPIERTSFIVRISRHASGRMTGVVERVKNGQKERFEGFEGLAPALARMTRPEDFTPTVDEPGRDG